MSTVEPRVYIACLSCYNAGRLHGHWLDADEDLPDAHREAFALNDEGFAPCGGGEFLVHDHEGFGPLNLGEVGVSEAAEVGQALRDAGDRADLLAALKGQGVTNTWPETLAYLEERYAGSAKSLADWAEDFHRESLGTDLGALSSYIDWERVARDLELGGDVFSIDLDGEVHVFWNR